MKCFVGYQPCRTDAFLNQILENREKIAEVYFPWGAMHSGRSAMGLEQELLAGLGGNSALAEHHLVHIDVVVNGMEGLLSLAEIILLFVRFYCIQSTHRIIFFGVTLDETE